MPFDFDREANKFLFVLIMADLLFILLHLLHGFADTIGLFYSPNFALTQERGYAEIFEYLKEYWTTVLLIVLALRAANLLYFCWALLFGYFLVDDSLKIHRHFGAYLSDAFGPEPIFGLNSQILGELTVFAFFGGLFLLGIAVSYRVNPDEDAKRFSRYLFGLFVAFLFFGIGVSVFQKMIPANYPGWKQSVRFFEQTGQLVVMSVICWFVFQFKPELSELEE